jgi:nitroreductase
VPAGRTLLSHYLSVHAVDGHRPGRYRRTDGALTAHRLMPAAEARVAAARLCLGQPLGGDSGYTLFACARLDEVLEALGDRGYRVAQAEAGIVVGRLQLAAFALGYGATGLTFYDDEVAAGFGTDAACMMACAVGVPAYRSVPGGPPGRPARLPAARS